MDVAYWSGTSSGASRSTISKANEARMIKIKKEEEKDKMREKKRRSWHKSENQQKEKKEEEEENQDANRNSSRPVLSRRERSN